MFSRRPEGRGSSWWWVDDPDFDLHNHITRVTLPGQGHLEQLQEFVAGQRSVPFDKSRPLWSMLLIDNVTLLDGTRGAAVMARFHHAIADGVRLVQVALSMCDLAEPPSPAKVGRKLRRSTTPTAIAGTAVRNVGHSAPFVRRRWEASRSRTRLLRRFASACSFCAASESTTALPLSRTVSASAEAAAPVAAAPAPSLLTK